MSDDITTQVLQLFEAEIRNHPEISDTTRRVLTDGELHGNFGDDEELLTAIVDAGSDGEGR